MSSEQLTREAVALPEKERWALLRAIQDSLDADLPEPPPGERPDADAFYAELMRRDEELRSGKVKGHTLEEVREHVRKVLECD